MIRRTQFSGKNRFQIFWYRFSLRLEIFVLSIILLTSVLPLPLTAQSDHLSVGDRIRLDVPLMSKNKFVGGLLMLTDSTVVLKAGDVRYQIPYEKIQHVDLYVGEKRHIGKGAVLGLVGGAALGAFAGWISYKPCSGRLRWSCFITSKENSVKLGALVGLVPGTMTGILIGARKTDRWRKVPREILLNMQPGCSLQTLMFPQVSLRWTIGSKK